VVANRERYEAQDVKAVYQPRKVVTVANETIHPRTKESEVDHRLMVSKPLLEEPSCVHLIVAAMGVQTATGEEKTGCSSKVEGGKEMKMLRAKRVPTVRVHLPGPERKEYLCFDGLARPSQPDILVAVHSHEAKCGG
jgi:hypothetical protein